MIWLYILIPIIVVSAGPIFFARPEIGNEDALFIGECDQRSIRRRSRTG
ncbi:hypothetical protein V6B33_02445 [Mangrovibacillus sp. Mu-81]